MIANVEMLELQIAWIDQIELFSGTLSGLGNGIYEARLDNLHSTEIRLEGGDKMFLYPSKTYSFQV